MGGLTRVVPSDGLQEDEDDDEDDDDLEWDENVPWKEA